MPACFAAIGTRLWPVMPGEVLTSRNDQAPSSLRIKSRRPQPVQPTMSNASSDRARNGVYNLSDWRTFERVASIVAEELGVPAPCWRIPEPLARGIAWSLRAVPRFLASYLAVWALIGIAAYALYRPHGTSVAGAVAIAAGLYELTPLKRHFRALCRERVVTVRMCRQPF